MDTSTFTPDNTLGGSFPIVTETVTLLAGRVYKKNTLLGKITASKKLTISLSAASDGSEVPDVILAEDVDATESDKIGVVYKSVEINKNSVVVGAGHTIDSVKDILRGKSIFLKEVGA